MANPVPALKTSELPRVLCRGSSSDIPPQTNVVPYTVQEGETLVGIALKHRMNHSQIRRLNSLFGSNTLYPGQILLVFHLNNSTTNGGEHNLNDGATSERQASPSQASTGKPNVPARRQQERNQSEPVSEEQKMYENIQLCVKDEEFCRLVPGDLVLNGHYLSFLPISSLSPKQKDGKNTFEFKLDFFEMENVALLPISSQAEEAYVKITWRNEVNELSSLFFIVASQTAKVLVETLTERSNAVKRRPQQADSYTSGKCLRSRVDFDINSLLTEPSIAVDHRSSSFQIDLRRTKSAINCGAEEVMDTYIPRRKRNSFAGKRSVSSPRSTERRGSKYFYPRHGLKKSFSFLSRYLRSSSIAEEEEEEEEEEVKGEGFAEVILEEPEPREPPEWLTSSCASNILGEKEAMDLRYALPRHKQGYLWVKLYDFARDGVSLEKLYKNVYLYPATLMVIQTTSNDTFGAYCSEPWETSKSRQFYGTGECFVFNFKEIGDQTLQEGEVEGELEGEGDGEVDVDVDVDVSELSEDEPKSGFELCVYEWTKSNNFFMNSSSSHLGVGGGGDGFAISLDSDLNHGTTNASATFGNPVLASGAEDGHFQILSLEMFGFESSRTAKRRMSSMMSDTELFTCS